MIVYKALPPQYVYKRQPAFINVAPPGPDPTESCSILVVYKTMPRFINAGPGFEAMEFGWAMSLSVFTYC